MLRRLTVLSLSASLVALSLSPALAIEPQAAAEALGAALVAGTGGKATFESASQDGSNIAVSGLTLTSHDSSDTVRFDRTLIEAPAEDGDGVFTSPRITMENGQISGESDGTLANASITGAVILEADPQAPAEIGRGMRFDVVEASDLRVTPKDRPGEVSVARATIRAGNYVNNEPQEGSGSVEDITISEEAFADSDFKPAMLGYGDLVFDVSWDAARNPDSQAVSIRDLTFTMQDGGSLTISGELGKVPDPAAFREAQQAAAAQIEIQSVTLRYEDASLAGKVLDYQAEKQGIPPEQYAQQIAAALPFLLAALNNPAFQQQVAGAVGTFLQDPQSLTVRLAPEAPISGAEIVQTVQSAPQTLPDRLNATITANSAE